MQRFAKYRLEIFNAAGALYSVREYDNHADAKRHFDNCPYADLLGLVLYQGYEFIGRKWAE